MDISIFLLGIAMLCGTIYDSHDKWDRAKVMYKYCIFVAVTQMISWGLELYLLLN